MVSRLSVFALLAALFSAAAAHAGEHALEAGSYAVTYRLELPHVERWAIERTATICVSGDGFADAVPVPVMSANMPFGACRAANFRQDGQKVEYDIVCPGRDAARAKARYVIAPGGFSGRIAMVMGAKNMTMAEIQTGRRLDRCDPAGLQQDAARPSTIGHVLSATGMRGSP